MKLRLFIICTILLTACTGQNFEKEDIVAVLDGNEIILEEILWQYSLGEKPEDRIIDYLKQEVVIREAKYRGVTVTEEEIEERKQLQIPNSNANERFEVIEEKEFYEGQASILEVSPEEYYEVWGQEIDEHINELFDEYKEEEKLIMKYSS
ncbi:hypothetical protein QGM71_20055 [Virgibacillus sp. C22-A2]|uniref:Peptidyl-prolyl cis-trans isomerase n=1 Tax=Virgibacillus tibetensis TaxID=3042313 RepID=A0ABU6KKT2_9BACI|nr:hypothetical protein [Virgibacillus sp. C22-A2]